MQTALANVRAKTKHVSTQRGRGWNYIRAHAEKYEYVAISEGIHVPSVLWYKWLIGLLVLYET